MLHTEAGQTGSLFDLVLPEPLRDLPADLAAIDELLKDDAMLAPFRAHWDEEVKAGLIGSTRWGRPTIAMATYVRLMVLKHRYGWGYEVLVREVSDSLHLRRFCGIPLHDGGPDESTVRKMTRRLGPQVVDELIRSEIKQLTTESARLLHDTIREASKLRAQALRVVRTMREQPTRAQVRAVVELAQFVARAEQIAEQTRQRFAGEPIKDRLVSMFDIHARPIRKGKMASPTQFGYVVQTTALTSTTQRGARGLLLPPNMHLGNPPENELLPDTVTELDTLDLSRRLKVAAFDGGFTLEATRAAMAETDAEVFIVGSKMNSGSRRHQRRLARYRVGCEGRVSHLKREFGARRSRLKGDVGAHTWTSWAFLTYNLHTLASIPLRR